MQRIRTKNNAVKLIKRAMYDFEICQWIFSLFLHAQRMCWLLRSVNRYSIIVSIRYRVLVLSSSHFEIRSPQMNVNNYFQTRSRVIATTKLTRVGALHHPHNGHRPSAMTARMTNTWGGRKRLARRSTNWWGSTRCSVTQETRQ